MEDERASIPCLNLHTSLPPSITKGPCLLQSDHCVPLALASVLRYPNNTEKPWDAFTGMKSFESWCEKSILKPHAGFSLLSSLPQECSRLFQAASPAIHLIIEPACACCDSYNYSV
jgi:hypothetical protein